MTGCGRHSSPNRNPPAPTPTPGKIMITLMVGTVILALTCGAFWHQQPARRQNDDSGDRPFPPGHLVTCALEWLVLMRRLPSATERQAPVLVSQQSATPEG